MNKRSSYLSAGEFPTKLLQQASKFVRDGKIHPCHIQLIPTNNCNLSCEWCSCRDQDPDQELPLDEAKQILRRSLALGVNAVTITGGGEPCMYPPINELIHDAAQLGYKIGFVTNGFLLHRVGFDALRHLTWARISASDDRDMPALLSAVDPSVVNTPNVDWGFSYVVTTTPNAENILEILRFVNAHDNVKYIRYINNLEDGYNGTDTARLMPLFKSAGLDTAKVILQGPKKHGDGIKQCLVSLLKPVIAADGHWYPCCGINYSRPDSPYTYAGELGMGNDFAAIVEAQEPFDGTRCNRCYFQEYNFVLAELIKPLVHKEFI